MTPKLKAEQAVIERVRSLGGFKLTGQDMHELIILVHAIDDADREERGVVDVQEIQSCADCGWFLKYEQRCNLYGAETHPGIPPSWCPRRKENRK